MYRLFCFFKLFPMVGKGLKQLCRPQLPVVGRGLITIMTANTVINWLVKLFVVVGKELTIYQPMTHNICVMSSHKNLYGV